MIVWLYLVTTLCIIMYDHVIDKNIFPSFVSSCIPQIDMMAQLAEAYDIKNCYDSAKLSNEGGYHSPTFVESKLSKLKDTAVEFSNDLLDKKGLGLEVQHIEY